MEKRSITIKGHRTSVALEPEFWAVLDAVADRRGVALATLIEDVDAERVRTRRVSGLASALRVFALGARGEAG